MAKLGDLILRVGADTSQLNKNLGDARKSIAKNTREIQNLGRNLTVGVTAPLAIMGATSVQAFREQNKAIAQVEAGLKSTAGQVGFTSQELQKMASDLQNKTLFGDEVILKDATAQLLTFTNISSQNFARTQQAALDLATRLDGDLKGASIQLGKALNDPVANLSALSRSGIQFSEDQKEVIKSLTETGKLAEAQTLILDELNKQYGGSAEAAAEADGGFTQLANSFGDLQEEIGRLLVQYLRPIIDRLKSFVQFLQGTSDGTKTLALAIAGVAAAIGPLLLILPNLVTGIKMARTAFALLNTTMLANPFGAVAAAIGLVVGAVIMLNNASSEGSNKVDDLKKSLGGLDLQQQAASIEGAVTAQEAYVKQLKEERDAIMKLAPHKRTANSQAGRDLKKLEASLETANADLAAMMQLEKGVAAKLKETADGASSAAEGIETVGDAASTTTDKLQTLRPALAEALQPLEAMPIQTEPVTKSLAGVSTAVSDMVSEITPEFQQFNDDVSAAIEGAVNTAVIGFGMMLGAGIATGQGMKGVGDMLLGVFADLAIQLGTLAIGYGIAIEQIKVALASLTGPVAIAAGVALVALGAGLKGAISKRAEQAGVPAFAEGGLVYGPTMGLVGEYPGAKTNPEVIAPLDKLRGMLGGQAVQVTGKISGRDILLTSERNAIDRNRVRGF
jgi:phage-related protein